MYFQQKCSIYILNPNNTFPYLVRAAAISRPSSSTWALPRQAGRDIHITILNLELLTNLYTKSMSLLLLLNKVQILFIGKYHGFL